MCTLMRCGKLLVVSVLAGKIVLSVTLHTSIFIGRRYMAEILPIRGKTLYSINHVTLFVCCYYQNKEQMTTFYFIDALSIKAFFKIFHTPSMLTWEI